MNFCEQYLEIVGTVYAGLNLTRILDPDEFRIKQYEDSLLPLRMSEHFKSLVAERDIIVDVGFGGGFPLLPLASEIGPKVFTGFEARGKKSKAVNDIAKRMGLDYVRTHHYRVEEILFDQSCLITFKAVGRIGDFLARINCTEAADVVVVFYKGPELLPDELKGFPAGWEIYHQEKFMLEATEGRTFVYAKKKNVPRGTKNSLSKYLVKLSLLV